MKKQLSIFAVCACLLLCSCENGAPDTSPPPVSLVVTSTETENHTAEPEQQQTCEASAFEETEQTSAASETEPAIDETVAEEPTYEESDGEEPAASTEEPPAPETETLEETAESAPPDEVSGTYSKEFFADDLFIGDSISTGLYLYYKLEPENVAASVGNTPYKAYTTPIDMPDGSSVTPLEYAESRQPKRVFIMLGSNGMASSWDIESMKDSYRTLVLKLQDACPDSEICCISVTPVTADTSYTTISNADVRSFNGFISDMCGELGLRYLDLYSLLSDNSGCFSKSYAAQDGLHFQGFTYDVMLSYIQNELS